MTYIYQNIINKIQLLRDAITDLKQVTGLGKDLPREFCPHILGTKRGVWRVLSWQFEGLSRQGDLPGWRGFDLDDLAELAPRDGEWHRGYVTGRSQQHHIEIIDTVVDPDHAAEIRESYRGRKQWPAVRRRVPKRW